MSDDALKHHREAMERQKARIFEKAAAEAAALERKWTELARLSAELGVPLAIPEAAQKPIEIDAGDILVSELIDRYKTDPESPYQNLGFKTAENYGATFKKINNDIGDKRVAELDETRLGSLLEQWRQDGKDAWARALMGALLRLASFGASGLKSKICRELKYTISEIDLPAAKPRLERMTEKHANDIRRIAHEMGHHTIALAQAIQFETGLTQKEVIGEWVPVTYKTPEFTEIIDGSMKWIRGLRWKSIEGRTLRYIGRGGNKKEVDISGMRMIQEELARINPRPTSNEPMIISEQSDKPYQGHRFRLLWRQIANTAGVPKNIENRDARPSGRKQGAESSAVANAK